MRFKSNHDKVCSAKKIVVNMHQVHEFSRKISFSAFPKQKSLHKIELFLFQQNRLILSLPKYASSVFSFGNLMRDIYILFA